MKDELPAVIGVVSDTHGLLRAEAVEALKGVDLIIHAGDVGRSAVLHHLSQVAPVKVVRGNTDRGPWAEALPRSEIFESAGRLFYVIHDLQDMDLDPQAASIDVVVSGHSHAPLVRTQHGTLYLNPGSIGPRRFRLPVAMARLTLSHEGMDPEIILLDV